MGQHSRRILPGKVLLKEKDLLFAAALVAYARFGGDSQHKLTCHLQITDPAILSLKYDVESQIYASALRQEYASPNIDWLWLCLCTHGKPCL